MKETEPNTSSKLALRPKSYIVLVVYKSGWPPIIIRYHYHSVEEATAHFDWIADQIRGQNGKNAKRKNVVVRSSIEERLRSKKLDKKLPPIARFIPPGDRERPVGGVVVVPEFEKSSKELDQAPKKGSDTSLRRVK